MASLWIPKIVILAVLVTFCDSTYKLCCDSKCETPISHGRTRSRKTVREEGHLTFPANAKLTVWAKHYNSQPNIWEAEMYGRWGLVNENDIDESIVHCSVPQHWVPIKRQDGSDFAVTQPQSHVSSLELLLPTLETLSVTEASIETTNIPKFEGKTREGISDDQPVTQKSPEIMFPNDGRENEEGNHDVTQTSIHELPDVKIDERENEEVRQDVQSITQILIPTSPEITLSPEGEKQNSKQDENDRISFRSDVPETSFAPSFDDVKTESATILEEPKLEPSDAGSVSSTLEPTPSISILLEETAFVALKPSPSESNRDIDMISVIEISASEVFDDQESSVPAQHGDHQTKEREYEWLDNVAVPSLFETGQKHEPLVSDTPIPFMIKGNSLHNEQGSFHDEIHDSSYSEGDSSHHDHHFLYNQHRLRGEEVPSEQVYEGEQSFTEEGQDLKSLSCQNEKQLFSKEHGSLYDSVSSQEEQRKQFTQNEQLLVNEKSFSQDLQSSKIELTSQVEQISLQREEHDSSVVDKQSLSGYNLKINPSSTEHIQEVQSAFPTEEYVPSHSIQLQSLDKYSSITPEDSYNEENFKSAMSSENLVNSPSVIDSQDSSFLIQSVKMFLPLPVETWLFSERINVTLIGICISLFVVTVPVVCSCCNTERKAFKVKKELKSMQDHKINMESHIKKLTNEKDNLVSHSKSLEIQLNDYQLKYENEHKDHENIYRNIEEAKKALEESYQSLQNDYNHRVMSLKLELENSAQQLVFLREENSSLQLQISNIEGQLEEAIQRKEESDAAKVQLEQDIFELRQNLQHITVDHNELTEEKEKMNREHSAVCDNLNSTREQLEKANEKIVDGNKEIFVLRECIQSLSELDGDEKPVRMEKIESLLDSTKAQTELRTLTDERDQLQLEVNSQALFIDELQTQNASLQQELADAYSAKENLLHQYQETQIKLKAITEYFEEKESHLHRRIGEEEIVRQRIESREAYAKERVDLIEQAREKEREELRELRQQMGDIEKGLMQQVITNEKRAEDALSQLRRTEQDLRSANKEITLLKKQLADEDKSSNMQSIFQEIPPHIGSASYPRPPLMLLSHPRGPPRLPPPYGPRGLPPPPFQGPSPTNTTNIDEKNPRKSSQEKNFLSRPPPPGMESRDSYYQRHNYPPPVPRPGFVHSRSPVSFGKPGDQSFDRPPIPGDMGFFPARRYPPRNYISSERRRPPSEPRHEDLHDRYRPPSNPILGAGVLFSSAAEDPIKYSTSNSILPPSQSLPLNISKENEEEL